MKFQQQWKHRPTLRWPVVSALILGLLGATLSFSHAAASIGIAIAPFRPLGSNFFAWKSGQSVLINALGSTAERANRLPLVPFGKAALSDSPLSARPAWLLGLGYEGSNATAKARSTMLAAERISRREPGVQLWLANDALRRNDATAALRHFDILLRTNSRIASEILPRLAMVLTVEDGRAALRPYARDDNPWFSNLMLTASTALPKAEPLARFLLDLGRPLPSNDLANQAYAGLVGRLASERSFSLLTRLYPKLPHASLDQLRTLSFVETSGAPDYAPVTWSFATSSDRGASPLSSGQGKAGMEFYGAPGTVGVAATKLVEPGQNRLVRFRIDDRVVNRDASALWIATCVTDQRDGLVSTSPNLMTVDLRRSLALKLPSGCPLVRIDMKIAGGTGQEPASLTISELELVAAR